MPRPTSLRVLDNFAANSRNLEQEKGSLDNFLTTGSTFSASAESILRQNSDRFVSLARDSLPSLQVYAERATGYPCLLRAVAAQEPEIERTFGGLQPGLHITLEVTKDNGSFTPNQAPVYGDGGGKLCYGLDPAHPLRPITLYYNPYDGYYDGQQTDPYTGKPPVGTPPARVRVRAPRRRRAGADGLEVSTDRPRAVGRTGGRCGVGAPCTSRAPRVSPLSVARPAGRGARPRGRRRTGVGHGRPRRTRDAETLRGPPPRRTGVGRPSP